MRQFFVFAPIAVVLALAIGLPPAAAPASAESLDAIVAVAGDDIILKSELDTAVRLARSESGGRADNMPRDVLRSKVLDKLIMRKLQVARAKRHNLSASDEEIETGLERVARQNQMSKQQFLRAVARQGMSRDQMRDKIREQILVSKVRRDQVMAKVSISDDDVDRYLDNHGSAIAANRDYRLRHILIRLPEDAAPSQVNAARDRARALRRRITSGDSDFATAARADSQGANAADGGQLGWIAGAYMPETFAEIVADLQPGEVSDVFKGASGFHLVKLENTRGGDGAARGPKVMVHEIKARHILLKPNEIRDAQRTRELADQLRQRIEAGDDFAALAREYSDDEATANQGGELGWIVPARFGDTTEQRLRDVAPGQISPVFVTRAGYEILKVQDRRQRDQTRQARRKKARQALGKNKAEEEGERWLREMRDEAYVDIRMPDYQPSADSGF